MPQSDAPLIGSSMFFLVLLFVLYVPHNLQTWTVLSDNPILPSLASFVCVSGVFKNKNYCSESYFLDTPRIILQIW